LEVWQWMLGQRNQQRTEFEVLPKSDKVHLEQ
jgi:hypothetical protein